MLASLAADGKVKLVTGSVDIGGTRASIAQQFGEVLGIGLDVIDPIVADTDTAGYTGPSAGSSASHKSGWAAHEVDAWLREREARVLAVRRESIGDLVRRQLEEGLPEDVAPSGRRIV